MITDKLGSYGAANREIDLSVCDHSQHKGLNNRVENSHRPILRRKRIMKRFKSARHPQKFTSMHDPIYNLHYFQRNQFSSANHHELRQAARPKEWIAPLRHRFTTLFDHFDIHSEWQLPYEWMKKPNAVSGAHTFGEEGLNDIVRHSHEKHVWLKLKQDHKNELILEIEDDGIGFNVAAVRQSGLSIGIRIMSTRITNLDGPYPSHQRPVTQCLEVDYHWFQSVNS